MFFQIVGATVTYLVMGTLTTLFSLWLKHKHSFSLYDEKEYHSTHTTYKHVLGGIFWPLVLLCVILALTAIITMGPLVLIVIKLQETLLPWMLTKSPNRISMSDRFKDKCEDLGDRFVKFLRSKNDGHLP